jgi:hypothetical protein
VRVASHKKPNGKDGRRQGNSTARATVLLLELSGATVPYLLLFCLDSCHCSPCPCRLSYIVMPLERQVTVPGGRRIYVCHIVTGCVSLLCSILFIAALATPWTVIEYEPNGPQYHAMPFNLCARENEQASSQCISWTDNDPAVWWCPGTTTDGTTTSDLHGVQATLVIATLLALTCTAFLCIYAFGLGGKVVWLTTITLGACAMIFGYAAVVTWSAMQKPCIAPSGTPEGDTYSFYEHVPTQINNTVMMWCWAGPGIFLAGIASSFFFLLTLSMCRHRQPSAIASDEIDSQFVQETAPETPYTQYTGANDEVRRPGDERVEDLS